MLRHVLKRFFLFGLMLSPTSALAQDRPATTRQALERNETHIFDDDLLRANGLDTKSATLRIRVNAARAALVRPRVSFVPGLVKSVENLP